MNKLEFYRWAVQDPETHAVVLDAMYHRIRSGAMPRVLREDFAGTSADSVAWVALRRGRTATAVDLDESTLAWAQLRAARLLGSQTSSLRFVRADVRMISPPAISPADIISVLNFSIFYFHERDELVAYFRQALAGLADHGLLVMNIFGGSQRVLPGSHCRRVTPQPRLPGETAIPEFDYTWEVRSFDHDRQRLDCRIHFSVADANAAGQAVQLRDAFCYDWRLWSIADLTSACLDAGFSSVQLWRHTLTPSPTDPGDVFFGAGDPDSLSTLEDWSAYLIACR